MAIHDQVSGKFTYYPIPKNASTTIKHWLFDYYKANGVAGFDSDARGRVHKCFPTPQKNGGRIGWLKKRGLHFTVVRDPVRRFISAYRNRVLNRGCLAKNAEMIVAAGLSLTPGLNEFIRNFSEYANLSREVAHHCSPQAEFIGKIYRRIDKIYDISELSLLEQDLIELTRFEQSFAALKSGGKSVEVEELDDASRKFLEVYLCKDFEMMKALSRAVRSNGQN